MDEIFKFLRELEVNNTRLWLVEYNSWYKQVMSLRDQLAQRLINEVATIEPQACHLTVSQCTYRLMRDTRFSMDKRPYKTHIGLFVCPPYGKKSILSGYYLHIEPGGRSLLCGGNYGLPSAILASIRADIRDNIEEYIDIVESPEFKRFFPRVGEQWLKTAPKGFDRRWEYIDYVRPKDFGVVMPLSDEFMIGRADPVADLRPMLEQINRLNRFINFSITESGYSVMRECR